MCLFYFQFCMSREGKEKTDSRTTTMSLRFWILVIVVIILLLVVVVFS